MKAVLNFNHELLKASGEGDVEKMVQLENESNLALDWKHALLEAAKRGQDESIVFLLPKVKSKDVKSGALLWAANFGHLSSVELLIEFSMPPHVAVYSALLGGHHEVAKYVCQHVKDFDLFKLDQSMLKIIAHPSNCALVEKWLLEKKLKNPALDAPKMRL